MEIGDTNIGQARAFKKFEIGENSVLLNVTFNNRQIFCKKNLLSSLIQLMV